MAFDFPSAPTVGQKYSPATGVEYTWDGITWVFSSAGSGSGGGGGGGSIIVSDTPPDSPTAGTLWYESDSGNTYIWYEDADSSQWVQQNLYIPPTAISGSDTKVIVVEGNDAPGAEVTGNYAKPVGLKFIVVELWGGGSACWGAPAGAAGTASASAGGGGGGYCRKVYKAADLDALEPYVVGKGGNTPSGVPGDGTASTFKGMSAGGGVATATAPVAAATGSGFRGTGGVATGGDLNINGGDGGNSFWIAASALTQAGFGGPAAMAGNPGGAGNTPPGSSSRNGIPGRKPGGGAGGAAARDTGAGLAAGGAGGRMVITEYYDYGMLSGDLSTFATKAYVDGTFLPLTGGTITGSITISATLTAGLVQSAQNFESTTLAAILAATGVGAVYLRPRGKADVTGQAYVNNDGSFNISSAGQQYVPMFWRSVGGVTRSYIQVETLAAAGFMQFATRNDTGTSDSSMTMTGNSAATGRVLEYNGNTANKSVSGSWGAISDARIKEVRRDYEGGLDEILQLQPRVFIYKGNDFSSDPAVPLSEDGEMPQSIHQGMQDFEVVGLIAQEAEPIMPSMVTQKEGWIDGEHVTDMRDLNPTNLTYALINAVKELAAKNAALEARLAALEAP